MQILGTTLLFFKCSEKLVFPKNLHQNLVFLVLSRKMVFFPENMILFFRRKIKDNISQKINRNMIFTLYSVNMVFLFPTNIILFFCQGRKSFPKTNRLKNDVFDITDKEDNHPRKCGTWYFF